MLIVLKVLLQLVTVISAIVSSSLDYKWHDKRTRSFKTGRTILFSLTGVLLLLSIGVTIVDDYQNNKKEYQLNADLKKVQEQNDGLQQSIKVLGLQNSNLLQEQRTGLVSLLEDQRNLNYRTENKIGNASDLLSANIRETIAEQKTTLANITGGDSFCYLYPQMEHDTVKLELTSRGEFPLYDITVTVEDLNDHKQFTYESPTISAMQTRIVGELPLQSLSRKDLWITLQTRYTNFEERIKLAKVNVDNDWVRWVHAIQVIRWDAAAPTTKLTDTYEQPRPPKRPPANPIIGPKPKFELVSIDYDFPRDERGYVDWLDYKFHR